MVEIGADLSTAADARQAAAEAALSAREGLTGGRADLAVVFASPHHTERAGDVVDAVREAVGPPTLLGCVGEAVLGSGREVEGEAAVSVWLGHFGAPVDAYHAEFLSSETGGVVTGWPDDGRREEVHLLLCDPFTFPADHLLRGLERDRPGTTVVGGMASGGSGPGETRLFLDDRVLDAGAVGAILPPGIRVRTLVSQGCRPVGPPYTVTRSEGNMIFELGGRPPMERVREVFAAADERDRALIARGLHIGRVIDEYKPELETGDFLIRGVVGVEQESGALVVGDLIEVGETVRFHVRDADSADEELHRVLDSLKPDPAGALLFTCNGRGSRLFPVPDHDASVLAERLGDPPVAGFFCAGELGPVGSRSFVHGFTASMAVFYEEGAAAG